MNNTEEEGGMMLRGRNKGLVKSGSIDHEDNMDMLNLRPQPFDRKFLADCTFPCEP